MRLQVQVDFLVRLHIQKCLGSSSLVDLGHDMLVGLVVDTEGMPTQLQVISPAGLGMDEEALAAVSRYRFAPATKDGAPVPARLNVDIRFEVR